MKDRKQHNRTYYQKNKDAYKRRAKEQRQIARDFIWSYLQMHPCVDCGEADPAVLEFDHVLGEKEFNVAVAPTRRMSIPRIAEEIKKCDVRCANCHRRKTWRKWEGQRKE